MALFQHCSVLFELKGLPFKEKNKIKLGVTENGGTISFVANKECSLVVTSDVSSLSPNRLRNIVKHQIPVVGLNYVHRCLEANLRLPVDDFKLDISSTYSLPVYKDIRSQSTVTSKQSKGQAQPLQSVSVTQRAESPKGRGSVIENYRVYTEKDHDLPRFPENFQVAKYSIFEKPNSSSWWVLELQSARSEGARQYRVVRYWKDNIHAKKPAVRDQMVFLSTSEEAVKVYEASRDSMKADGLKQRSDAPPQVTEMGSAPLQQLLLEEKLHAGELSQEVGVFVELLWQEALGCLEHVLKIPVHKISLNDVTRAEGLLLQIHRKLIENKYEEMASLWSEYGTLLPKQVPTVPGIFTASKELDLCQLIRDILNVTEMTLGSAVPSSVGKYRALRCSIEAVPIRSSEFEAVASLIQHSEIQVQKILRVNRAAELQNFRSEIGNIKSLLHSSGPKNFVGILSRGLLLPRVVVEYHGIARTDAGNLGSGIYFTDDISTSLKYSQCSMTEGSRMLLVCDVALGRCKDLLKKDLTLTQAPKGHDSVHGVRNIPGLQSEFMDDEYVVYSPDQVKLKYVVQFSLKGDPQRNFTPEIISCEEPSLPSPDQGMGTVEDGIDNVKNPLENVTAGLLNSSGQQIPLQAVHVKCKLMDLLSQVIIFQEYTNQSSMSIEAKYVFPLDDSAAVCGFEAFINGKHVVGQVKEKETARREYKQAIEKGHGAYLMDQDAPDVFTISVGNLPPGATVLIKITFVSELIVKDGSIFFSLPSSVAPWQESAALNQTTQVTVEKVCVTDEEAKTREFHLDMSIEMPHEITEVKCITHKVKMKKTDCKAVVSVLPGEVMGPEGFQLSVTLTKVHVPRMWVEKHPDKDSQACMLVFYPNFDITANPTSDEVVLLLDASQSMKGESLNTAQRIALQILKTLDRSLRVNVIFFGTDHTEAFLSARPIVEAHQEAKNFIKHFLSAGGSTELWRPLRALSLLPPSSGTRNLLLLSDGHIQNTELTLQLLRDNVQHSRLFTCGLSPTANRHMLRALAQAGGGAYEFFDPKTLHTWPEKVASQVKRMMAPGARSVSVKWQQFNPTAPPPVQAPKQLHALFNDCHTLVFGFVPHCTQATLLGNLSGQEIKTMVSTSELQKTKGTFLHKLTARALIRDFEDGSLDSNAALHEGKKAELKSFVIELSKEFSILSQFTSFVAIEERDSEEEKGFTNIPKLIAEEGVDFLPYMSWTLTEDSDKDSDKDFDEDSDEDSEDAQGLDFFSDSPKAETWGLNLCDEAMDLAEDLTMHGASNSFYAEIETTGTEDFEASTSASARVRSPCEEEQVKSGVEIPREKAAFAFGTAPTSTMDIGFLQCSESIMPPSVPKQFVRSVPQGFGGVSSGSLIGSVLNAGYFTRSESSDAPAPPPVLHSSRPSALFGSIGMQLSSKASDAPAPPPVLHSSRPSTLFGSIGMHLSSKASDAPTPPPPVFLSPHPSALILGMQLRSKASDAPTPPPVSVPLLKEARTVKKASASVLTQFGTGFASYQQPPPAFYSAIPGSPPAPPSFLVSAQAHASEIPLHTSNILTSDEQPPPPPPPPDMVRPPLPLPAKKRLSAKPMTEELSPYYSIMESSASPVRESISCSLDSVEQPLTPPVNLCPLVMSQSTPLFVREFPSRLGSVCSEGIQKDTSLRRRDTETGAPTEEPAARRTEVFRRSRKYRKLISTEEEPSVYEKAKLKWTKIFDMQHPEGYWELTSELGTLLNCDISRFASDFLKRKGIKSLGVKAYADILKLLATLLVLQLMRLEKLKEGEMLRTLLSLEDSLSRPDHWEAVDRAVKWARWADRQYPCIYSRLEIGLSWDSSTKQLLGFEGIPHLSPLTGLNLNPNPVRVH